MKEATADVRVKLGEEWHVPLSGSLTLDETREYIRATFTLPYNGGFFGYNPTLTDTPRVLVEIQATDQDGIYNTITADLHLRSIKAIDAETMQFDAASDEMLLADYGVMEEDYTGLVNESSIRATVNAVLGRVFPGKALTPFGNHDGPIVVLDTDNLVDNPSLLVDRSGWLFWKNAATGFEQRLSGADTLGGPWFFRAAFQSATSSPAAGPYYIVGNVTERTVYAGSVWVRPNIDTYLRFGVEFRGQDEATLDVAVGPTIACPANVWTRLYHDVSGAPVGARTANVTMYGVPGISPNWADGNRIDAKALRFGPILSSPLTWQPGTSAWDYLMSLCATLSLRLYCDEKRHWRLVPEGYVALNSSSLTATVSTLSDITQMSSRDDDTWADGVVIVYEWEGADGIVKRKSDRAGNNGKVVVVRIRRPFPGYGAAELHLGRLQMQGIQYEFTNDLNLRVRPSSYVSLTVPGELPIGQRIQSMSIDFATAEMTVKARAS